MRQDSLQMRDVLWLKLESLQESYDLIEASKNGEVALEWTFAEVHLEHTLGHVPFSLPLRISHGKLVQVRQQRIHPIVGLLRLNIRKLFV